MNVSQARFELAASAVAAILLAFAGFAVWRSNGAQPPQHVHEVRVAWRCESGDAKTCKVVSDVERCTTCHEANAHTHRPLLVDAHASIGCIACHGGDGYALEKKSAHEGLASLGSETEAPAVQARCAACHVETRAATSSPAKAAWARWLATREGRAPAESTPRDATELAPSLASGRTLFRSMRCGACHAARDASPPATPLDVLALRGTPSEVAHALEQHASRGSIDLGLDAIGAVAVATHLLAIESADSSTAMQHRASIAGSSAEEGRTLYEKLACSACHTPGAGDDGRLHLDLAHVGETRTPDWVAFYLADPTRANPSTAMPSLRLSPREAASLAQHVARARPPADPIDAQATTGRKENVACRVPGGETKTMTRDACGEAIVAAAKCGACHSTSAPRSGPSLARFGEANDAKKLVDHAGYRLDPKTKRDLVTYLLAQRDVRVRPDLRVPAREGEAAFASLGCAGCHALDDVAAKRAGPSLFGEGLRTQPQWLFDFLRAPQRHAVRPPFHPEWAYRDLVPAEHVTPRMPTFPLDEATTTDLVRFFVERDGASFPYAGVPAFALSGEPLTTAVADVTHKDRGACLTCHTIATPDVARARESEGKLAPPLALAHDRLRPAWVEACLAQPDVWVAGMPALAKPMEEIDHVRDLVFALRERSVLPPPGAEGQIPALGLGDIP